MDSLKSQQSLTRKAVVLLLWFPAVLVMFLDKERIGFSTICAYLSENLETLVTNLWYGMLIANSLVLCTFLRVILTMCRVDDAGSIMNILFSLVLATTVAVTLEKIELESKNTYTEEIILCSTAGYFFYEMFYLRVPDSLEDRYKALGALAGSSFIISSLRRSAGASVLMAFLFLFSSPMAVMKVPTFGSVKYIHTTAYKCSVLAAYAFAIHQRLIVGLGLVLTLWTSPKFRFEQFETPMYITAYCWAIGATYYLVEIVRRRQATALKKEREKKLKRLGFDEKVTEMVAVKRKVVHAYI